jgi:hypothetical protein
MPTLKRAEAVWSDGAEIDFKFESCLPDCMRVMEFGAGIIADRQLRWMRPVLLKTLSLSETA